MEIIQQIKDLPFLVNVELVKKLRQILNPAGLERTLERWGFPVDLEPFIEKILQQQTGMVETNKIMQWIKDNFLFFINGDPYEVAKAMNDYILLEPYVISFFGYPIEIYTDPAHLRKYLLYAIGIFLGYKILKSL
ncbi:MAG: hypothetical protein QXF76_03995 [Candidatus Anstonellales archaeon]